MAVLPRLAKVFPTSHRDGVGLFLNILIPPPPQHPRFALIRAILVNFPYPKSILFEQTNKH